LPLETSLPISPTAAESASSDQSLSPTIPQELAPTVTAQDSTPTTLRSVVTAATPTASEASSVQDSSVTAPAQMIDKKKSLLRDFAKLLERYDKNASKLTETPEHHLANHRVKIVVKQFRRYYVPLIEQLFGTLSDFLKVLSLTEEGKS